MSATAALHRFIYDRRSALPRPVGGLAGEYRNTAAERADVHDQLEHLHEMALIEVSGGYVTKVTPPPEKQ